MKKIVVLGATGMLGHKTCQELASGGHQVIGCLRGNVEAVAVRRLGPVFEGVELVGGLDVMSEADLKRELERAAPDFVVNAVGLVKQLDEAADPCLAVAINSLLPHRLAKLCGALQARLIHISTDCVFDGRRGRYRESDSRDADDLYGRSKALGETTKAQSAALTLRTSFIGRELKTPGHGLVEWFLGQAGGRVRGFARAIYSGLTSRELARVIRLVVEVEPDLVGVHQVASEPITKYDLLQLIRSVYRLEIEIEKVDEPEIDRSLVMESFTEATGYRAPSWEEMIRDMYRDPTPYEQLAVRAQTKQGESQ